MATDESVQAERDDTRADPRPGDAYAAVRDDRSACSARAGLPVGELGLVSCGSKASLSRSPDRGKDDPVKTLLIINGPAHGSDETFNAIRASPSH